MPKILVLSVGPGSAAYLTGSVQEAAQKCDLLVGGSRNLRLFSHLICEKLEITGELAPVIAAVKEQCSARQVGILVSGDAGIYSMLPRLKEELGRQALVVYPGVSAAQYLFARLGLSWQDAVFTSLHGRDSDLFITAAAGTAPVVVFTDRNRTPADVCRRLLDAGLQDKKIFIGEELSYPTEKISEGRPGRFTDYSGSDLNLVVIADDCF